jgi:hypothetical protein
MVRRDLDKESEVDLVGETSEIPTQASALVKTQIQASSSANSEAGYEFLRYR